MHAFPRILWGPAEEVGSGHHPFRLSPFAQM